MENCCMEQGDAVLSAPAWQFRMLHLAHRTATDALLDKYGVRDCGHPFIFYHLHALDFVDVTAALKALEKQGCIVREAGEQDMRRTRIRITDKGREIARRYVEVFTEVDEAMYSGFTDEELRSVSAYFGRITENLRALAAKEGAQC